VATLPKGSSSSTATVLRLPTAAVMLPPVGQERQREAVDTRS